MVQIVQEEWDYYQKESLNPFLIRAMVQMLLQT